MKTLNIRVIGDNTDSQVAGIVSLLIQSLSALGDRFSVSFVTQCPAADVRNCIATANRPCALVVGAFGEKPSEVTASAIATCVAGTRFCCRGEMLVLEPAGVPLRNLSLYKKVPTHAYANIPDGIIAILTKLQLVTTVRPIGAS